MGKEPRDPQLGGFVCSFIVKMLLQQIEVDSILLLVLNGHGLQARTQVGDCAAVGGFILVHNLERKWWFLGRRCEQKKGLSGYEGPQM